MTWPQSTRSLVSATPPLLLGPFVLAPACGGASSESAGPLGPDGIGGGGGSLEAGETPAEKPPSSTASVCSDRQILGSGTADETDYESITVDGKQYFAQSNAWGGADQQITVGGDALFRVDSFAPAPGAKSWEVGSYPSVLLGSRYQGYGTSEGSGMPIAVRDITRIPTALSANRMSLPTAEANTAYDVWFSPAEVYDTAHPDLAVLLMVWFGSQNVNPITSAGYSCAADAPTYTTACPTHGTFESQGKTFHRFVGSHDDGTTVMSYLAESPMDEWEFDLADFIADATEQGVIAPEMYLQNIQAGFEIVRNGSGLSIDCFYADVL